MDVVPEQVQTLINHDPYLEPVEGRPGYVFDRANYFGEIHWSMLFPQYVEQGAAS